MEHFKRSNKKVDEGALTASSPVGVATYASIAHTIILPRDPSCPASLIGLPEMAQIDQIKLI